MTTLRKELNMFEKIPTTRARKIVDQFEEHLALHLENGNYRLAFTVFVIALKDLNLTAKEFNLDVKRHKLEKQIDDYNFAMSATQDINAL